MAQAAGPNGEAVLNRLKVIRVSQDKLEELWGESTDNASTWTTAIAPSIRAQRPETGQAGGESRHDVLTMAMWQGKEAFHSAKRTAAEECKRLQPSRNHESTPAPKRETYCQSPY
jgi:hypothetical protein